jgi:hypothetical protein
LSWETEQDVTYKRRTSLEKALGRLTISKRDNLTGRSDEHVCRTRTCIIRSLTQGDEVVRLGLTRLRDGHGGCKACSADTGFIGSVSTKNVGSEAVNFGEDPMGGFVD